jgi:hypothetical protein
VSCALPDRIRVDEPFEARVSVFSTTATTATVTLYQGETVNGLDGTRARRPRPGRSRSCASARWCACPGDVTYAARIAASGRAIASRRTTASPPRPRCPGDRRCSTWRATPARAQWFRGALANGEFEVELRGANGVPQSTREMERFDFIVLSDVAAESVPSAAQDALTRYVREMGGGFLMAGGDHGFGLGGLAGHRRRAPAPGADGVRAASRSALPRARPGHRPLGVDAGQPPRAGAVRGGGDRARDGARRRSWRSSPSTASPTAWCGCRPPATAPASRTSSGGCGPAAAPPSSPRWTPPSRTSRSPARSPAT